MLFCYFKVSFVFKIPLLYKSECIQYIPTLTNWGPMLFKRRWEKEITKDYFIAKLLFGYIFNSYKCDCDAQKHDSNIYLLVSLHLLVHSWRGTWAKNFQIWRGKQNLRKVIVEFIHHLTFPWNAMKAQKAKCVLLHLEGIDIFINVILYYAPSGWYKCFLFHKGETLFTKWDYCCEQ